MNKYLSEILVAIVFSILASGFTVSYMQDKMVTEYIKNQQINIGQKTYSCLEQ